MNDTANKNAEDSRASINSTAESPLPKVSVIIPVYNSETCLGQCLDSILCQTLRQIQIICVDDGSTDGSPRLLSQYAAMDSRIQILTQKNKGAGAARNLGLGAAQGEYLSFLDSDDFFEPDMLELACQKADACQADFVVFQSDKYYMDKQEFVKNPWVVQIKDIPPYQPFKHRELTDNIFKVFVGWAWDKLYRRSFVLEHGLLFQEQRTTNDLLFVYGALALAKRIAVVDKVLAHQRMGSKASLSVTREKSWRCFYDALLALRGLLKEKEIYWELEQDFINYALHFSLWNLRTLDEPAHHLLKEKLCQEWFAELGIAGKQKEYFYDSNEFEQYQRLTRK